MVIFFTLAGEISEIDETHRGHNTMDFLTKLCSLKINY